MYLFSRRRRLDPARIRDGVKTSVGLAQQASEIVGIPVSTFRTALSPSAGTVVWSCFAPDLKTLQQANEKLEGSASHVDALEAAAKCYAGHLEDTLLQIVHGSPDPARRPSYVESVRAVCATGKLSIGLAAGVEIAIRAEKLTGAPTTFVVEATGVFGGVGWLTAYDDIEALERASAALLGDRGWLEFLYREVSGAYQPGATQTIYQRLA